VKVPKDIPYGVVLELSKLVLSQRRRSATLLSMSMPSIRYEIANAVGSVWRL